jgi:hypothetical protein
MRMVILAMRHCRGRNLILEEPAMSPASDDENKNGKRFPEK